MHICTPRLRVRKRAGGPGISLSPVNYPLSIRPGAGHCNSPVATICRPWVPDHLRPAPGSGQQRVACGIRIWPGSPARSRPPGVSLRRGQLRTRHRIGRELAVSGPDLDALFMSFAAEAGPVIGVCQDRSPARLVPLIGGGAAMSFSCASRGTGCPAGPVGGLRREPSPLRDEAGPVQARKCRYDRRCRLQTSLRPATCSPAY